MISKFLLFSELNITEQIILSGIRIWANNIKFNKDTILPLKFFYKQFGKKHRWIDRLIWSDEKWMTYISNRNLETYVISKYDELVGFFELLYNPELKETEISYFGLLEDYIGKGIGGYALSEAIKRSFEKKN